MIKEPQGERIVRLETRMQTMCKDIADIKITLQSIVIHIAKSKVVIMLLGIAMPCIGAIASSALEHFWK